MISAALPANEAERLRRLRELRVLDTAPETAFDDLVELAAQFCGTPIALVSLVDSTRQWFKARLGISAPETPREHSFCAHAIHGRELFLVEDAHEDPRFADNPLVIGNPKIRFYAGVPLFAEEGLAMGTLCVIDTQPRRLGEGQREALLKLGRQASAQLHLRGKILAQTETLEELHQRDEIIQQQQLKIINSAKMSSLGEMAGSIAHEVNNPLAIICMSASQIQELLRRNLASPALIMENAVRIEKTAKRIHEIVKGLRAFSRDGQKDPFQRMPLATIFADTQALCQARFHSAGVALTFDAGPKRAVECRPVQISQVLLNLINNAFDAVKTQASPWVWVKAEEMDGGIRVSVTDSGEGIRREIRSRMMDPFFTTKNAGEGTGLGLSIAGSLLADHSSKLEYDEATGHTRLSFYLPFQQALAGSRSN